MPENRIFETLSHVGGWLRHNAVGILAAVIIIAVFTFIACMIFDAMTNEQNRIDSGVIVDKQFTAGAVYNRSGRPVQEPARYAFTICGNKNGELVEYTFEVDTETYSAYKIGDTYHR